MKTITAKEFLTWVFAQKNSRPFNYSENYNLNECGCPMVQFGRSKGISFSLVGTSQWITEFGETMAQFDGKLSFYFFPRAVGTYGEFKAELKKQLNVKTLKELLAKCFP